MTQTLGETREAMSKSFKKMIAKILDETPRSYADKYYILVIIKPVKTGSRVIRIKPIVMKQKPQPMLATVLFSVDVKRGELSLENSQPGDWPTYNANLDPDGYIPEMDSGVNQATDAYQYG